MAGETRFGCRLRDLTLVRHHRLTELGHRLEKKPSNEELHKNRIAYEHTNYGMKILYPLTCLGDQIEMQDKSRSSFAALPDGRSYGL